MVRISIHLRMTKKAVRTYCRTNCDGKGAGMEDRGEFTLWRKENGPHGFLS